MFLLSIYAFYPSQKMTCCIYLFLCNRLSQTTMAQNKVVVFFFSHHHFVGQGLRLALAVCFGLGLVALPNLQNSLPRWFLHTHTTVGFIFLAFSVSLHGLSSFQTYLCGFSFLSPGNLRTLCYSGGKWLTGLTECPRRWELQVASFWRRGLRIYNLCAG